MLVEQRKEISKNQEILRNLQAEIGAATDILTQIQMRNSVNANCSEQQEEAVRENNLDARQDDAGISNGDEIQIGAESDNNAAGSSSMFLLAKEVLLEFTGKTSVRTSAHNLTEMQCRLLWMAKLKGVVLQWLHADPARIIQPFEELLQQLKLAFDGKVAKGELRRNFERRNWKSGESFVTYYDSKAGLARDVNMDEEELVDGIIEGIPVDNLRMQAKLQSFESAEKVLRVFAGMVLPIQQRNDAKRVDKSEAVRSSAVKELRCYNCNTKGHWKKDEEDAMEEDAKKKMLWMWICRASGSSIPQEEIGG